MLGVAILIAGGVIRQYSPMLSFYGNSTNCEDSQFDSNILESILATRSELIKLYAI